MRAGTVVVGVAALAAACVCVRLGVWQLDRWQQRRAANAALEAALERPAELLLEPRSLPDSMLHRPVAVSGTFDERHQVLLAGVEHQGEPGVHVVTPLILAGDSTAVLVDRGWLPAADAMTARPQDWPVGGPRTVSGYSDTLGRGAAVPARPLESVSLALYSTDRLDWAALAPRFPYPLTRYYLRQLPAPDAPPRPLRETPPRFEPTMHLSYAVQWFAFAAAFILAPWVLSRARRPRGASGAAGVPAANGNEGGDREPAA